MFCSGVSTGKNKVGAQDTIYISQFEVGNEYNILRFLEKIRREKYSPLAFGLSEQLFQATQRHFDDHINSCSVNGNYVIGSAVAQDLCMYNGLGRFCRLITRESTSSPTHIACGTSTTTPNPFQTTLVAEVGTRAAFSQSGFFQAGGASLRMCGLFSASTTTNTIAEMGVFDASTNGTMFSRNVLTGNTIAHTLNVDFFIGAEVIELVPIV